jgi:hypothetical protein
MKVITVTEARVVALFKSISVAPIASPRPCITISHCQHCKLAILVNVLKTEPAKPLGHGSTALNCLNHDETTIGQQKKKKTEP